MLERDGFFYCNCAECGRLLLGARHEAHYNRLTKAQRKDVPELVKARVLGRPYCEACLLRVPEDAVRSRKDKPCR